MDFFDHQERARKLTSVLVFYYVLAVLLIVLAVYAVIATVLLGAESDELHGGSGTLWNPELFMGVALGTLGIVAAGTVFKVAQLSAGGAAVARMLGGRPIQPETTDIEERKILNVVEEMALASGTPVPPVFLLDEEDGINAFAAGFNPGNAVIGVTRGCVRQLTRDELQGVIAHEFSHILNGDMRLNLRLMGVLHGILVIALIGYGILRSGSRGRVSRSRNSKGGGGILFLGLGLTVIGYVGVFFAKLIKSAVSRQREFLADASAVQFTRNPPGIAGALAKIAGLKGGGRLHTSHAEEASHLFFTNGLAGSLTNLMATHPPLPERIRRIDASVLAEAERPPAAAAAAHPHPEPPPLPGGASGFAVAPGAVAASVGTPQPEHLVHAALLMERIPSDLRAALRSPVGARAVLYSLLLQRDEPVRAAQLRILEERAPADVYPETLRLAPGVQAAGAELRLPLADLAIATLRNLAPEQYRPFRESIETLVQADEAVDLFEFTLERVILRHLDPVFLGTRPPAVRHRSLEAVAAPCGRLLSCLAYWGADDAAAAAAAFEKGAAALGATRPPAMSPVAACGLQAVDEALRELGQASPPVKRRIIDACSACVGADGWVSVEEAELLRAVADELDCPIPPFLPGAR